MARIKENDFRIGNLVSVKDREHEVYYIEAITKDKIGLNFYHKMPDGQFYSWKEPLYVTLDQIKPIRLTENILCQYRLRKYKEGHYGINNYSEIKHCKHFGENGEAYYYVAYNSIASDTIYEYVHQFQNLYFSLRNEELEGAI